MLTKPVRSARAADGSGDVQTERLAPPRIGPDQLLVTPPVDVLDVSMSRVRERLIDLAATALLLSSAWVFSDDAPGLSGVVIAAAIQFWLGKNATHPEDVKHG